MYSNCLIEALKAKLKEPKNIRIFFVPRKVNRGEFHFMWTDGKKVFHAYNKNKTGWLGKIFFQPTIKSVDINTFQGWFLETSYCRLGSEATIKYAKKLRLPTYNVKGFTNWATCNSQMPRWHKIPSIEEIKGIVKGDVFVKIAIKDKNDFSTIKYLNLEDVIKLSKTSNFLWKYVTPYESDYEFIGKPFEESSNFNLIQ